MVVHAARDRVRALVRSAFPRRRARVVFVRGAAELQRVVRTELVDVVLVDVGGVGPDEGWRVAELATSFPSAAFVAVLPLRASDGASLARCASIGLADVLIDGVDDVALRAVVLPLLFTSRFAAAFADPPPALGLHGPLQRAAWTRIVSAAGRLVRTVEIASALGVSREHLSRSFGGSGPSLKRLIDLVRIAAAGELSRNPGYHVRDIAAVLGFASGSHLAHAAFRVAGLAPTALPSVPPAELIARFAARAGSGGAEGATRGDGSEGHDAPGEATRDWAAAAGPESAT